MTTDTVQHAPKTLDQWIARVLSWPATIECPHMLIKGRDNEPLLFAGPGHILLKSSTQFSFVMHGTPYDQQKAFGRLMQAQRNPHNALDQFRLEATDYSGIEWQCGYTRLVVDQTNKNVWHLSGSLQSLSTQVVGADVCAVSSVEAVFDVDLSLPTPMNMLVRVQVDGDDVLLSRKRGRKTVDVVGTEVSIEHSLEGNRIFISARTSSEFSHPYAENWIGEPFRLLLGQLVFPRLVARNFGDGTAMVSLRPSPRHDTHSAITSILEEPPFQSPERFWDSYRDILTLLVHARDDKGHPYFGSHPLTQYYEEIVQATSGSNWVLCMTLASAIEGVVDMLVPKKERLAAFKAESIKGLAKHVSKWDGDDDALKTKILKTVEAAGGTSAAIALRALGKSGIVKEEQTKTWDHVRNRVAHGVLVSPWAREQLEWRLRQLLALMHSLSREYIRKMVAHAAVDAGSGNNRRSRKLAVADVQEIKLLLASAAWRVSTIALAFGVSYGSINAIKRGKSFKYVK